MTPEEFKTGKRADGSTVTQAGHAHFNSVDNTYIQDALKTLSPSWHGDKVALAQFKGRLNGAIDAANKLDQVKKTLFYGRDNNLIAEGQLGCNALDARISNNFIHGVIGVFTEAGELLEALRDGFNNGKMDHVNIREEIGDLFWYVAILLNETGGTFEDAMQINIAKLKARFPDKFEADKANNRDLVAERAILEDGIDRPNDIDFTGNPEFSGYADSSGPLLPLVPAIPASGPEAVKVATEQSKAAFDAVNNVGNSHK